MRNFNFTGWIQGLASSTIVTKPELPATVAEARVPPSVFAPHCSIFQRFAELRQRSGTPASAVAPRRSIPQRLARLPPKLGISANLVAVAVAPPISPLTTLPLRMHKTTAKTLDLDATPNEKQNATLNAAKEVVEVAAEQINNDSNVGVTLSDEFESKAQPGPAALTTLTTSDSLIEKTVQPSRARLKASLRLSGHKLLESVKKRENAATVVAKDAEMNVTKAKDLFDEALTRAVESWQLAEQATTVARLRLSNLEEARTWMVDGLDVKLLELHGNTVARYETLLEEANMNRIAKTAVAKADTRAVKDRQGVLEVARTTARIADNNQEKLHVEAHGVAQDLALFGRVRVRRMPKDLHIDWGSRPRPYA